MALDDHQAADRVGRVCALLDEAESLPDPDARTTTIELLQALLELYGEALARIVAAGGDELAPELAADELVSHLLLLHGLHPQDVRTRVEAAVGSMRVRLGKTTAELMSVQDKAVHLRLRGGRGGCRTSRAALTAALEEAVRDAAPEIERVVIDEAAPPPVVISVDSLLVRPGAGAV
jgi:hypothetical protein